MHINTTPTYTEIYAKGGGYLTQAYPTNYHTFNSRIILGDGETPDSYKEVSEQEKKEIEERDAAYKRPPQSFIDLFCNYANDTKAWNKNTGFFEHNGIKDIDYKEAMQMVKYHIVAVESMAESWHYMQARTHLPIASQWIGSITRLCQYNSMLEIVDLSRLWVSTNMIQAFYGCSNLHTVYLKSTVYGIEANNFKFCPKLKNVFLHIRQGTFHLEELQNLSIESLEYLVEKKYDELKVTVIIHPDVFDLVPSELFAKAEAKQINIVTP